VRKRKREEERPESDPERPALWLRLAQQEVDLRMDADESQRTADLDRELQMLARMRAQYPDIPVGLAVAFAGRLNDGLLTWSAWDDAVAWLEATEWYMQRPATDT
jgi:hypothetical protein